MRLVNVWPCATFVFLVVAVSSRPFDSREFRTRSGRRECAPDTKTERVLAGVVPRATAAGRRSKPNSGADTKTERSEGLVEAAGVEPLRR